PSTHMTRFLAGRIDLPDPGDRTAVDLRVGCSVSLPPAVVAAAEDAATALAAVAPRLPGWAAYHRAFIERWGPGAAVPLREVVDVLGFPAGYRGSPRRDPARFSARDSLLADLAQRSALDGCAEVVLDDELITALCRHDAGDGSRRSRRFCRAAAAPHLPVRPRALARRVGGPPGSNLWCGDRAPVCAAAPHLRGAGRPPDGVPGPPPRQGVPFLPES